MLALVGIFIVLLNFNHMKFNSRTTHVQEGEQYAVEVGGSVSYGGWYEIYDINSGGELFHEEGELDIDKVDGKWTLTGYDGTFELHSLVVEAVAAQGILIDL
jgi:hypothetical protein